MPSYYRQSIGAAFAAALCFAGASAGQAQPTSGIPVASLPIAASGEARAPYAWIDFCKRSPAECRVDTSESDRAEMTPKLWKSIVAINNKINREIEAVTDEDHWGVVDRWEPA